MTATGYWISVAPSTGRKTAVARGYWPESTLTEVNYGDGNGWVEKPLLMELDEDPYWESTDEATVEAWLADVAA